MFIATIDNAAQQALTNALITTTNLMTTVTPLLEMIKGDDIRITPSVACKSDVGNASRFNDLMGTLNLNKMDTVDTNVTNKQCCYGKFDFVWTDKIESDSYDVVENYLRSCGISSKVIGGGNDLPNGLLYDVKIHALRPRMKTQQELRANILNQSYANLNVRFQLSGRSDIFVYRKNSTILNRLQCNYCIEIKTVAGMNGGLEAQSIREATLELIGLNVDNPNISPAVILTNLVGKHYVLYITLGDNPEISLNYNLHVHKFETFPKAVWWVEKKLARGNHTVDFGRKPTPRESFEGYVARIREEEDHEEDVDDRDYGNVSLKEPMDVDDLVEVESTNVLSDNTNDVNK